MDLWVPDQSGLNSERPCFKMSERVESFSGKKFKWTNGLWNLDPSVSPTVVTVREGRAIWMCLFSPEASCGLGSLRSFVWLFCLLSSLNSVCLCPQHVWIGQRADLPQAPGWKGGQWSCVWSAGALQKPSHCGSFIIRGLCQFLLTLGVRGSNGTSWMVCLTCCPSPI